MFTHWPKQHVKPGYVTTWFLLRIKDSVLGAFHVSRRAFPIHIPDSSDTRSYWHYRWLGANRIFQVGREWNWIVHRYVQVLRKDTRLDRLHFQTSGTAFHCITFAF